jgi:SulP family sulfate permease
MLKPKLFTTLKDYSWEKFRADFIAGIIVGIVSLPLAIAFAIASGVSPERGLFTAVVAGLIVSVLGGSRVQIGGPTGAFVVIVYGIVQRFGLDGLTIATCMAGILLIIMGFAGFGAVIKFIPYPVIVGFTSGIALIIFSSQVNDLLGLSIPSLPADFFHKWIVYIDHFKNIDYWSVAVSCACLLIIILWRNVSRRIPGSIIALILSTIAVNYFRIPVETIGSHFGAIPHGLPAPSFPAIHFDTLRSLFPTAVTIALLAGIESLLSAVVADGMIGGKHRPNMELIAQGAANLVTPLFGGIPATGAIARTTTNINNGGRTPVAGIINSIVLLAILLFLGKWAALIPLPCLAAILVIVAYHMSEWRSFLMLLKSPKSDVAVLVITFALTILLDLTVAIQTGVLLAALLFIRRMSLVTNVGVITRELVDEEEKDDPNAINKRQVPDGVEVYEINGPFFFGASYKFMEITASEKKQPKVRILRMRNVPAVDATGLHVLQDKYHSTRKQGGHFLIADIHTQPMFALERSGLLELIGEDNIFGNIDDALNHARTILGLPKVERPGPFVPTVEREMKNE